MGRLVRGFRMIRFCLETTLAIITERRHTASHNNKTLGSVPLERRQESPNWEDLHHLLKANSPGTNGSTGTTNNGMFMYTMACYLVRVFFQTGCTCQIFYDSVFIFGVTASWVLFLRGMRARFIVWTSHVLPLRSWHEKIVGSTLPSPLQWHHMSIMLQITGNPCVYSSTCSG